MILQEIQRATKRAKCNAMQLGLVATVLFLTISATAMGQPTVDRVEGLIENGQTVDLIGSQFDVKPTAAPIQFDHFDSSGQDGQLFEDISTYWDTYSDNPDNRKPKLSSAEPRYDGAGLNAEIYLDRVDYENDHIYKNRFFDQRVFASFWVRFDPGSPSTHDGQVKLFRINNTTEPNEGPWIYYRNHKGPAYTLHRYSSNGAEESTTWYGHQLPENQWTQVSIQMDQGTVGNNDGSLRIWHNGNLEVSEDNLNFLVDPNFRFQSIRLGEYVGNDSPLVATERFDDLYVDDTWARVEIGNNANYNSCTHREMQRPTSWSDNGISVVLNRGDLPSHQDAFLFVVDKDGNTSAGKKITWGDDPDPVGPGQPTKPVLDPLP